MGRNFTRQTIQDIDKNGGAHCNRAPRLRQEANEFEVSLGYRARPRFLSLGVFCCYCFIFVSCF